MRTAAALLEPSAVPALECRHQTGCLGIAAGWTFALRLATERRMSASVTPSVSVVITARDAAATIGDAVRSALAEPEAAEVIVVDDASRDATTAAAEAAAGGDGRLKVIRCAVNVGPAAARNRALEAAAGAFVAVLDADDFLLPGRFARLLAVPGWDMVADNILFVAESASPAALPPLPPVTPALSRYTCPSPTSTSKR